MEPTAGTGVSYGHRWTGRLAVVFLLATSCCLPVFTLAAGDGVCDPGLKPPVGESPYSYQPRGDRCEGIYAREIAGTTLLVASFTRAFADFQASAVAALSLTWATPARNPVSVRAYSLKPQLYYQMDTALSSGVGAYSWPTNVLAALGVRKSDLGVVARVFMPVGDSEREVYLPLRVGVSQAPADGKYDLVLLSDQELSEVFITLTGLGPDGKQARILRRNTPLGYGFYPAQRPIHVTLPEVVDKGLYVLAAGATLRSGGSYTLRFWFYHDGT
jgi:hypothetical protein